MSMIVVACTDRDADNHKEAVWGYILSPTQVSISQTGMYIFIQQALYMEVIDLLQPRRMYASSSFILYASNKQAFLRHIN